MALNGLGAHGVGEMSKLPELIYLEFTNPILKFHLPHVHQPHSAPLDSRFVRGLFAVRTAPLEQVHVSGIWRNSEKQKSHNPDFNFSVL